jgi:VanZ like family
MTDPAPPPRPEPAGRRWGWTALALGATLAVQAVSALPEPRFFGAEGTGPTLEAAVSKIVFAPGSFILNVLHLPVFVVLGWLWCRVGGAWLGRRGAALALGVGAASLFALANELSQGMVPTRHASVTDALVDLAGVALGAWLFRRGIGPVAAAPPGERPERA